MLQNNYKSSILVSQCNSDAVAFIKQVGAGIFTAGQLERELEIMRENKEAWQAQHDLAKQSNFLLDEMARNAEQAQAQLRTVEMALRLK